MILNRTGVYRAVVGVLDAAGIAHRVERGGKHASIRFEHGGRERRIIVPLSPSDHRAPLQARAFVRRLLRAVE